MLLLLFLSLAVLPVYALSTAAGSHSAVSGKLHAAGLSGQFKHLIYFFVD